MLPKKQPTSGQKKQERKQTTGLEKSGPLKMLTKTLGLKRTAIVKLNVKAKKKALVPRGTNVFFYKLLQTS